MLTSKKTDNNNNKILQDIIDFEILKSLINYLLISKKNKNNNNSDTRNQYKISRFYSNRNEILNYILVSKKWYSIISSTISNNIIDNKSFGHWLKIIINNNKLFTENDNDNNKNKYDRNNLFFINKEDDKLNKISFNKEFSIIKIKFESIIDDYFKFNLFLDNITIDDFKEIKNKFENNQLLYNKIVVDYGEYQKDTLFEIHEKVSNENSETISNLFKILQFNYNIWFLFGYKPDSEEEENDTDDKVSGFNDMQVGGDEETVKIFKILKGKNLFNEGSFIESDNSTHINYSALFDPDNSGQQVESIKVLNNHDYEEFVEARDLIKVHQFENLHSISIPIKSFQLLSNLSSEMGFYKFYRFESDISNPKNMKSELNQMVNSLIASKSLKNFKISCSNHIYFDFEDFALFTKRDIENFANKLNEIIESFSNSFKPLFSELNTSIERIELDFIGFLNINTFSNLLKNKSIKYLYLYDSDSFVYSSKPNGNGSGKELHKGPISINQYLFDNIFSSPLTSIRHYRIKFKRLNQIKLIFNLILNNIFKLQLYSLIFEIYEKELIGEFVLEFKNLINKISTQQQQQKSNNINLIEIKIKIVIDDYEDDEYFQELNNINNPYFTTVIKKLPKWW
ncbi:hypothetical protein ACTFIW_011066 [Dictyostelium discoideum]